MTEQAAGRPDTRTPAFTVEWLDGDDARRTWVWDPMHWPYPLTPLSIEFTERIWLKFGESMGAGPVQRAASIWPHGYRYSLAPPRPDPAAPRDPAERARRRRIARDAQRLGDLWRRECLPPVRAACAALQGGDYASMPLAELAARIDGLLDTAATAFAGTLHIFPAQIECSRPFVDFCQREFGADGERRAALMMQGFANESSAVEIALWDLAEFARARPAVARALTDGDLEGWPGILRGVRGRVAFLEVLEAYLDRYGWRPDSWFELSQPTWREDPRPALRSLRRYLSGETPDPRAGHARAARTRRREVRRARTALRPSARRLARFERLLRTAQQHVPVSEERALWQLTIGGSLRAPCVVLGRKMARAGALDDAGDVFHLHLAEIRGVAAGHVEAGLRTAVAERRRRRERAMAMMPPRSIGAPFRPQGAAAASRFSGGSGAGPAGDGRVLTGSAASAGVVRATARVVQTPAEGERVAPGDVLVCRSTSPAWTPLFSRVSAVVAESGGVLSHCAIVAREYAIPCVTSVAGATTRIRDGATITVDGGQGLVRLEQ